MTLHILDMPTDAASLASWLEDRLVSGTLGELVAELSAAHPAEAPRTESLESLFGPNLEILLAGGLSALPEALLRNLIRHPWLLLPLQERIFINGSQYWSRGSPSPTEAATLNRVWSKMSASMAAQPQTKPASESKRRAPSAHSPRNSWIGTLILAAATFLIGLFLSPRPHIGPKPIQPNPTTTVQTGWGWNKPDAFRQDVSRDVYLKGLADAANEWFAKKPDSRAALALRINQFRQGCSMLLLSEHKPLPDKDRQWLHERCRDWAAKLDGHLQDLESGGDLETIRTATDQLVTTLVARLRERAA